MRAFEIDGRYWYAAPTMKDAVAAAARDLGINAARIYSEHARRELGDSELDVPVVPGDKSRRMGTVASHLQSIQHPCLLFSRWNDIGCSEPEVDAIVEAA